MRAFALAVLAGLIAPALAAAREAPLEIRFCPAVHVRAYPLESRREIESVVLQDALVINHGLRSIDITDIDLDLMRSGQVVETHRLFGVDLRQAGRRGAQIQSSGMITAVSFQFCGDRLVGPGVKLGGPALAHEEGLLVFEHLLTFQGPRDALRLTAHGRSEGGALEASAALPIAISMSKTVFRFPLRGVWWAGVGATPHTGHRWAIPEEFALDIGKLGGEGLDHRGDGMEFRDYYGYGAPVLAAADGRVVEAVDGMGEDRQAIRRPDETLQAYSQRYVGVQAAKLANGPNALAGNHVVIDHGDREFSLYAHLKPGSVAVKPGQAVKAGDVIGALGSSGNSTSPHLHFQVCDGPGPLDCAGVPITFQGLDIPWADYPRPVQSGDVVVAR